MRSNRRPNILFITADQWRADCLGAAGHPILSTPAIDRLCAEGTRFSRHYCTAAPCSPSRAGLYTGLYQMTHRVVRNGTPLDSRFDNIAMAARRAGHNPTLFGYTDIALDPRGRAADDPALTSYEGVLDGFTHRQDLPEHERPWHDWLRRRGRLTVSPETLHHPRGGVGERVTTATPAYGAEDTQTTFLTDTFIDWLGSEASTAGWFAHVSLLRPHPPFVVPEPFNTLHRPGDGPAFRRNATREAEAAIHPYVAFGQARQKTPGFLPGTNRFVRDLGADEFDTIRAIYYGMVSEVDAQIGRLFAAIRDAGQWEDTIVVLTSDHGEMMGDHWFLGKGGFFDASYHIPLIIRAPGMAPGRVVDAFTSAADIFPTLSELMGVRPRNPVDGRSLLPFLTGGTPAGWRDAVHWEYDFRSIAHGHAERHFDLPAQLCNLAVIRDEHFKYVHFAALPPVLFDLDKDPDETRNIAEDPAYRDARLAYAERLLAWRARHLDQTLANVELTPNGPVAPDTVL